MEESKTHLNQIFSKPPENPLISQPSPPQTKSLILEFEEHDKIRIEEEEKDELKENATVLSIQPPNTKPINEKPLHISTIKQIRTLYQKFKPKQISSSKKQPFLPYEGVFRALNLWEFLNLDFESEVRSDLIVELICTYNELESCGFVRGSKICVGKFDLAHALKVPVEKNETCESIYREDDTKDVILKFLSRFVLLVEEEEDDDTCILPKEAHQAIEFVKNGTANEVDWCGLIWGLVVKDIVDACMSGCSKFASYLHCLIKAQFPNLLLEAVYVPELESHLDVSDSTSSLESSSEEEFDGDEIEDDHGTELMLGNNGNVDLMNDINWNDRVCNEGFQFGLRRCNSNSARNMEFENFCGEDNGFSNLEMLNSSDLLHSFSPQMNLLDQNVGPSSSNFFGGNSTKGKRHVNADDIEYQYDHNNNQQKRLKIGTHWEEEERPQSEFHYFMEQMQEQMQSMCEKAKMLYLEKEQACLDSHMQRQCLNDLLIQKDELIKNLQKTQVEERQKWNLTVDRYRHELNVLANIAFGYKNALKETRKKFDEYMKMCPKGDKFLYHDVVGSGGLVLPLKEIEKMKFEKEEEMKLKVEELVHAFERVWLVKFDEYNGSILLNGTRLAELKKKVEGLKERIAEGKRTAEEQA